MKLRHCLLTALAGAGLATGAQAQSIYGELGYSPLSLSLSVPLLGLKATASPKMVRGLVGFQLIDSFAVEVIGGLSADDSRIRNGGASATGSTAKVDQLYGVTSRRSSAWVRSSCSAGWARPTPRSVSKAWAPAKTRTFPTATACASCPPTTCRSAWTT